ncbi:MAG: NUDIX domain-containing protein [Thermoleophilia bacterium]|nr:NUDIX domain-containing protein [Thermoleophilia bacterium]
MALWLERSDGDVIVARRGENQVLAGLWLPPLAELGVGQEPAEVAQTMLEALLRSDEVEARSLALPNLQPAEPVRHSITRRLITVHPFCGAAGENGRAPQDDPQCVAWEDPARPARPTSALTGKLLRVCRARA